MAPANNFGNIISASGRLGWLLQTMAAANDSAPLSFRSSCAQSSTNCGQAKWSSWSFSPHIYVDSKLDMVVRKSCHINQPGQASKNALLALIKPSHTITSRGLQDGPPNLVHLSYFPFDFRCKLSRASITISWVWGQPYRLSPGSSGARLKSSVLTIFSCNPG